MSYFRSHNCGELSEKDIDKEVFISGWINKKRDHGGVLFIDLRDHFGITQCVVNSDNEMFPPCDLIISWAIERPKPTPDLLRLLLLSTL